ncbi:lysis system i-spanin subunit Rz [Pseudomonas sp. P1B16]|uniref:lysis system i-spanin subunit Rz n=1 Tax=Pseudomonas sp. P1B16 TaxID=2986074 RepID=UPI002A23AFF7|nr:lysis system i-spanin subunit Rz [Pseudomonas sp. P1B16]WPM26860.1 lysis system i-spanin subunit Rz [Pseudomonas sp. P1B16]
MRLLIVQVLAALLFAGSTWLLVDRVLQQRDTARSERDTAQEEASGLREAARINGERLATAAANDAKHTEELSNALNANQDLRRAVDARDQRLLVKATCPVRADTAGAGVADAAAPELAADARSDYFTLRDQLALSKQMILGLQDHIRSFCTNQPATTGTEK